MRLPAARGAPGCGGLPCFRSVFRGAGTVINIVAVVAGTLVGCLIGGRLSRQVRTTVMQGLGLVTLFLGVREAASTRNVLLMLGALLLGGLLGEALRIEDRLVAAGTAIEGRVGRRRAADVPEPFDPDVPEVQALESPGERAAAERPSSPRGAEEAATAEGSGGGSEGVKTKFVEGFLVASLVFCVGPLTILGSLQDGLRGDIDLLATKSLLDAFASLAFAATLGWGVGASILTIAVVQGGLTASAALLDGVLTNRMIDEMSAVGGLLLIGIGLRLLEIKEIRVASFLPALAIAPLLVAVFGR